MKVVHCPLHDMYIVEYGADEHKLFTDDNRCETVIFADEKGKRTLKRFVIGKCDEECPTVQAMMKDPDAVPAEEDVYKEDSKILSEVVEVMKKAIPGKELKKTVEKLRSIVGVKLMDAHSDVPVKEEEKLPAKEAER